MNDNDLQQKFSPIASRMQAEGLPDLFIRIFRHYYGLLLTGQKGMFPEETISPVDDIPNAADLTGDHARIGQAALQKSLMIKLNGGLGTSMGLEKAKSLLPVKDGLSFLDITARHALAMGVPMLLMNSFATRADSLERLAAYPELMQFSFGADFLQHKAPKIRRSDFSMVSWPDAPDHEWTPPGHGDLYAAIVTSGILDALLHGGYEFAFISNADNLGASIDPKILGYFAGSKLPFMMEVTDRTEIDRKGGHIARGQDGRLILRELAQTHPEDHPAFQNIQRHHFFNTNNLWVNLKNLKQAMDERDGILGLPLITNAKTVDPRNPDSTPVYQLETAMGAAIGVFEEAGAIRVPRTRFAPVKTTNDLLLIRSGEFTLTPDYRIGQVERQSPLPVIDLDPEYYKFVDQLDARFPGGIPSLAECQRLTVRGDVCFDPEVVLRGEVFIEHDGPGQLRIENGAVLKGHFQASSQNI